MSKFTLSDIKEVARGSKTLNQTQVRRLARQILESNLYEDFSDDDLSILGLCKDRRIPFLSPTYQLRLEILESKIRGAIILTRRMKESTLPFRRIK